MPSAGLADSDSNNTPELQRGGGGGGGGSVTCLQRSRSCDSAMILQLDGGLSYFSMTQHPTTEPRESSQQLRCAGSAVCSEDERSKGGQFLINELEIFSCRETRLHCLAHVTRPHCECASVRSDQSRSLCVRWNATFRVGWRRLPWRQRCFRWQWDIQHRL